MLQSVQHPAESYEARRRREVAADLRDVQARIADLNDKIRKFRSLHTFWYANESGKPVLCWRVPSIQILPQLKAELARMEADRCKLGDLQNALLAAHAAVRQT